MLCSERMPRFGQPALGPITCPLVAVAVVAAGILAAAVSPGQGPVTLDSLLKDEQGATLAPLSDPQAPRHPVPAENDVAAARDLIRQAYEDDYAAAAKGSPRLFVAKLLEAVKEVDDPPRKYALLLESQRLSLAADDLDAAIDVASRLSTLFEVDAAQSRLDVLLAAAKSGERDDAALCQAFLTLADQCLQRGQAELAERAVGEALSAAKRLDKREKQAAAEERRRTGRKPAEPGNAANLLERVVAQQRDLKNLERSRSDYEKAMKVLGESPDDPAANTRVGRYRCFVAGDWEKGLEALQCGESGRLSDAAKAEAALRGEEKPSTGSVLAVAGAWWKAGEASGLPAAEVQAIKRHAAEFYERALPDIEDPIERTLASKRIDVAYPDDAATAKSSKQGGADKPAITSRRGGFLKIPCSAILPAPADLSPQLVQLLPTADEVAAISNHVNVPDGDVARAKSAFFERLDRGFSPKLWTVTDAVYLMQLSEKIAEMVGSGFVHIADFYTSQRKNCSQAVAAAWVISAPNEQELFHRMKCSPAEARGEYFNNSIDERRVKAWLTSLGPEYSTSRRKLQAIEYLVKQGVATEGMRRYAEALSKAP